jgi:hypothetical protein
LIVTTTVVIMEGTGVMPKSGEARLKVGPLAWAVMLLPPVLMAVLALTLRKFGIIGKDAMSVLLLLSCLPALFLAPRFWGRLDEPSREAHKFAHMSGWGSISVIVAFIALVMVFFSGPRDLVQGWVEGWIAFSRGRYGEQQGAVGAYLAILACSILQGFGYLLAWIGWWARQRIGTTSD